MELETALEDVGVSADGAVDSLREFLDVLFEAGILTMSARDATARFHEAIDGVDTAISQVKESQGEMGRMLNKNKTDFDLTTEAGRLANGAFQDVARSGMDAASAMAENGASQDEVQGKIRRTYDGLLEAAQAFGLSEDAARELTREVLGVPDSVSIDSWMSEEAKRVADETNNSLDRIDGRQTRSNHTHTVTTIHQSNSPRTGRMANHSIPEFSGGGSVRGPGTGTSDSIIAAVSNGEHVLTAREVQLMGGQQGVYAFRAGLTGSQPQRPSGRDMVPAYATGGAVSGGGRGGVMTAEATLVGARVEFGSDGLARFVDGRVKVSMGDPSVIRAASEGLADQSARDSRGPVAEDVEITYAYQSINEAMADEGAEFTVNGISGDGLLGSELGIRDAPGRDGDVLIERTLPSRTVTVAYTLKVAKEASHAALTEHRRVESVLNGLMSRRGLVELELSHLDGYFMAAEGGLSKSSDYAHMHQGTMTFYCPKPFLYGSTVTTTIAGGLISVGTNHFVQPVIVWTTSSTVGSAWIEVDGVRLRVDRQISEGQQIRIDCERMETRVGGVLNVEDIKGSYPQVRDGSSVSRHPGGPIEFRYQERWI
ncbi:hypothetical protein [Nesterenkonia pannonica]|uniref:distal tail protein Dit n=1 Tax=Nesterenkonia pannonica TaxID=1548602 RepID=UPI0021640BB5|nr:distal tail protein Dit [Nesterenkonia pannonica]